MVGLMYEVELRHDGLHKYRLIRGSDKHVVEQKATAQRRAWDEMWRKKQAAEKQRQEKARAAQEKEEKKGLATDQTQEAQDAIEQIENILKHTLDVVDRIDWDSLIDESNFPKQLPPEPEWHPFPKEPKQTDAKYRPKFNLFDHIIPKLKEKKVTASNALLHNDHLAWQKTMEAINEQNKVQKDNYNSAVIAWEKEKNQYLEEQDQRNQQIREKKKAYFEKDPEAVMEYCDMVLSNSQYPDSFPQEYNLDYNPESKIMIVDYFLPSIENLPTLKEVKYVLSKDEFTESHLPEAAINKMYDSLLYQITLRTIHELYEADQVVAIDSIVFNGWVRSIDKGTGQEVTACILSVQTNKEEFLAINIASVDPKTCFKTLQGVGSSKLHGLSPIAPIMKIDREDKRFVSSYDVADTVDELTNLAAMDWEDFEHLIREVFEKEFSQTGGEVKITQASRDRGVDAVAFDPDPIRGGKIVIQAKRYTNVVGVSAVRDLYGTVLNEGATKGILVTTANYGPDAYAFAKGKPLTLLSGANLLHLLEKHGHKAKIDLREAKQIIAEQKREEQN